MLTYRYAIFVNTCDSNVWVSIGRHLHVNVITYAVALLAWLINHWFRVAEHAQSGSRRRGWLERIVRGETTPCISTRLLPRKGRAHSHALEHAHAQAYSRTPMHTHTHTTFLSTRVCTDTHAHTNAPAPTNRSPSRPRPQTQDSRSPPHRPV